MVIYLKNENGVSNSVLTLDQTAPKEQSDLGLHCLLRSIYIPIRRFSYGRGWSGGVMILGKLPMPGHPTIWMIVGQGPIVHALVVGGCLEIFTLLYPFSPLSPSLWETARYRLKYCLKGLLNPKQPTNQILYGK